MLLIVGVTGAFWVQGWTEHQSLHNYAEQNAERNLQRTKGVELSEKDFAKYVEYAFLFSVKEREVGKLRVRFQAGVCLAAERTKAGQSPAAWTVLVAKATADMVMGAELSMATPDELAVHSDNPIVQSILSLGEFESVVATIATFREKVTADTLAGAVPSPGTEAALAYGTELRKEFVRELTAHPKFIRELRAHLQRVSQDANYPLSEIIWSG